MEEDTSHSAMETKDVVLYTREERRRAKEHMEVLRKEGKNGDQIMCSDISTLASINVDEVSSLHLIVDTNMYRILTSRGRLSEDANSKFRELDDSDKTICVVNSIEKEFEDVYSQIPKNVRSLWTKRNEDQCSHKHDGHLPKPEMHVKGVTGGSAETANVAGSNEGGMGNTTRNVINAEIQSTLVFNMPALEHKHTTVKVEQDSQSSSTNKTGINISIAVNDHNHDQTMTMFNELDNNKDKLESKDGVRGVDIKTGSVIIALTVDKRHIMTDAWIQMILKTIFYDILKDCFTEEMQFHVTVDRHISLEVEEFLKIYSTYHSYECVPKFGNVDNAEDPVNLKKVVDESMRTSITDDSTSREMNKPTFNIDEPVQVEPGHADSVHAATVKSEHVQPEPFQDVSAQAKPFEADRGKAEPVKTEPVQIQTGQAEPFQKETMQAESSLVETDQAKPKEAEPGPRQPVQAEPGPRQPVQAEPGPRQPVQAEPGPRQPVQAEPGPRQPVQAEPGPRQPVQAEPGPRQPVQAEPGPRQPVQAEPGPRQPVQAKALQAVSVPSEAMQTEPVRARRKLEELIEEEEYSTEDAVQPLPEDSIPEKHEKRPRLTINPKMRNSYIKVGVAGGTADITNVAGIIHGGVLNMIGRTKEEIQFMTAGMIRVSAVEDVVNKMNTDQHWITITGNAGDGKTTLGCLVLKEFLQKNVKVFTIDKPEEYYQIADMKVDRVIMLDDRFGAFIADHQLIKSWRDVIQNILRLSKRDKPTTKVIFISRKNVLKESKVYLGHLTDDIFNKKCILDLSKRNLTDKRVMILEHHLDCVDDLSTRNETGERLKILEYHLGRENVTIAPDIKHRVCKMQIAHGFPHCCKVFSKLKSTGYDVDIVEFFESPLKFLDMTTIVLYHDNCKRLFKLMIKNGGQLDVHKTIKDEDQRQALLEVEKEQEGSYITLWINGICKFAHQSVYESVLNVINDIDPLYCVQYATLSVIRQKMFISISDEEDNTKSLCNIIVKPMPDVLRVLAERFYEELIMGDYSIFEHRLCKDRRFCEALVSCLANKHQEVSNSRQIINEPGEDGKTMLWTAFKSGNITAVCTLMAARADVHDVNDAYGRTPLHYICQEGKFTTDKTSDKHLGLIDSIGMIITDGRANVNICDKDGRTPLHYLLKHQTMNAEAIQFMVSICKSDLNLGDTCGSTPLHYFCRRRNISTDLLKVMITEGKGNLNQCEQNMSTPLHFLCSYSSLQLDTIDLVIQEGKGDFNKADEHGSTPLHYSCDNTDVAFDLVLQIVNTAKGDINKQDNNGITPFHVLCQRSHNIGDILTLSHQGDKTDMYGNTPLHFLCRRRGVNAEVLQQQLKQIPETDMKKQNSLGHTPFDYLTDQEDRLPWIDGIITRSPEDVVLCRLNKADKYIFVLGQTMTLDQENVHGALQVDEFHNELNNMAWSGYSDTSSSPVLLPPSPFLHSTYWETNSQLTWKGKVETPLLEMGVVEGPENLHMEDCVSVLPRSVVVSVRDYCLHDTHKDDYLCIQVWRTDQEYKIEQICACVTLPRPTFGEAIELKFGLVLDVGRGKLGFIDVARGEILCKVDQHFTESVFPVFNVDSSPHLCSTRMRLVSGREISMDDRKIQLIQQVLSD